MWLLVVDFSPCWAHFGPLLGAKILQSMTISSLAPNSILWLWDYPKNRAYLAILMGFIDFPPLVVVFKTTTTTNIIPVKQKRGPTMDPVVVEAWNFSWDLRFDSIISCQGIEKKVRVYLSNGRRNANALVCWPDFRPSCRLTSRTASLTSSS